MAVKEYIPIKDVKITTEKAVREKPSLAELTTVETPGKPVPASNFEKKRKRKTTKKKTTRKRARKLPPVKKDSIMIITEKPQAAAKIAAALGVARKYTEDRVSFYEVMDSKNNRIIVASAVGHLLNLTYAKGEKGWPIFKIQWVPSYNQKRGEFTRRYYEMLEHLSRRAKEFIIATDYDIEGEVIGWNVLRFICGQKTAKRMKYSTLTAPELRKSYENLMPELDWGHAYAGEARHIIDWLYGINLSRALMSSLKKTDAFRIMSIGRVQGPALKVIVDREREIENFKSEPFWQIFAQVSDYNFKHPKDIFAKKELDKFKEIKEVNATTKKTEESILPPPPFDLTTLQREAYRLHKLSPSATLKTAQKLYLEGLISYPRTSSQKVPDSIEPKKILKKLQKIFPMAKEAKRARPMEGKKSDPAHPSIYPTGDYRKLSGDEENLYNLIAKRFISLFMPDAKTANTRVSLADINNPKIKFTGSGLKVLDQGWTKIYPTTLKEETIPELSGLINIDKMNFQEKETQPPKRYTPTSLVTTLEKKNLGTKATRSMIVDTLFDRGYLDGRSIKATPLGLRLIEALEKYSPIIIDENLTNSLDNQMEEIQHLKSGFKEKEEETIKKTEKIISDISKDFKAHELEIGNELVKGLKNLREKQREESKLVPCPTCKEGNLAIRYSKKIRRYFIGCDNYPKCTHTSSLPPNSLIKKSEKTCESCNYPKLLAIRKGRRPWEFCWNQECEIVKKQREEWERKKAAREAKGN